MDGDNSDPVQTVITLRGGGSGGAHGSGVVGGASCGWWCLATNKRKVTTDGTAAIRPSVRSVISLHGSGRSAAAAWIYVTCVAAKQHKHEEVSETPCSGECEWSVIRRCVWFIVTYW